jgi:hypothetical protein
MLESLHYPQCGTKADLYTGTIRIMLNPNTGNIVQAKLSTNQSWPMSSLLGSWPEDLMVLESMRKFCRIHDPLF